MMDFNNDQAVNPLDLWIFKVWFFSSEGPGPGAIDQTDDPRLAYIHFEHRGAPVAVSDEAGVMIWQAHYQPFGEVEELTDVDGDGEVYTFNLRYPGQYHDRESGYYYNYFRDYDSVAGRYIQSDPIGLGGGLNTYAYVFNNPLKFIDPTGLDVTVSIYPGAFGAGHVGIGVNSPNTTGFYPAPGASTFDAVTGQPVPGAMQPDIRIPTDTINIPTTPAQDQAIQDFINQRTQNPGDYDLNDRNCATTVRDALGVGGINTPNTIFPRTLFNNLQNQFGPRP
ncbi:MAG: RHS repeat-associated core domain-containing protein [Candidatus Thiodiazotropha endolucinida]